MSGMHLFVYKNEMLAFSDYFVKNNLLLTKLPLTDFIKIKDKIMIIPLDSTGAGLLNHSLSDSKEDKIPHSVAISLKINQYKIMTLINNNNLLETFELRSSPDSYMTRSTSYDIECAASTGLLIYDDVGKIYEEAYYSCGYTPPPYYVVNVNKVSEALVSIPDMTRLFMFKDQHPDYFTDDLKKQTFQDSEEWKAFNPNKQDYERYIEEIDDIKLRSLRSAIIALRDLQRFNDILF